MKRIIFLILILLAAAPLAAAAQSADSMQAAAERAESRVSRVVSIGKWATLGVAAAGAAWGFSESARADDLYHDLERACQEDPERCASRRPDGGYTDATLEATYQDVLSVDRTTRRALFIGQTALLTSAVLFVLDLRHDPGRPDIEYEPDRIRIAPGARGGLELRLEFD